MATENSQLVLPHTLYIYSVKAYCLSKALCKFWNFTPGTAGAAGSCSVNSKKLEGTTIDSLADGAPNGRTGTTDGMLDTKGYFYYNKVTLVREQSPKKISCYRRLKLGTPPTQISHKISFIL